MKDILIIAHYTGLPTDSNNNRFHYLAQQIDKQKNEVELVTTNFMHTEKVHITLPANYEKSIDYKFTIINEPGYLKNVSFKRIYSHHIMGLNLEKYLITRKKPDVIYCAVPSLSVGKVASQYAKKNKIKFIIDIQDLWPEAFQMVFDPPIINKIMYSPLKKKARTIYENADEIIGVSQTYVEKALKYNNKAIGYSAYLGTDLSNFDQLVAESKTSRKPLDEFWIVYIGTLGKSYDLFTVIDSIKILKNEGIKNIKFIVMGDGPLLDKFKKYARSKNIDAEFLGRLSYPKMVKILSNCDVAVNPIAKDSAASIINKVGDYAAAGLPVINSQESKEYQSLLIQYESGLNAKNGNSKDMAQKIKKLYENNELRKIMGENSRLLAINKFDRQLSYGKIIEMLEE